MMILKEHNISVRLPQERAIDTGIVFVQNDKDVYKLNIRVFDGVYEIDYTEVEEATITFSKADGKVVQGDMQIEADQLTYVLGTNEIAAPGKLIATIQLLGANERLTTARFLFRVEKDLITENAVKSTNEFPILQRLKEELEAIDVVDLTRQFLELKLELKAESGTFTPYLFGLTTVGTPTYSLQSGVYYKIGNLVHVYIRIDLLSKGGMEGVLGIGGLPFPASNTYASQAIVPGVLNGLTFGNNKIPIFTVGQGVTYLVGVWLNEGNSSNIQASSISDNFQIRLTFIYRI